MTQATFAGNAPAHQSQIDEATFQRQIIDMAVAHGWSMRYHNLYAPGSDRGYPDLTLVHPRLGVIWFEVKGPRPHIYERQVEWLETLQAAGAHAYLVYPTDYDLVASLLVAATLSAVDRQTLIDNQYRYKAQPIRGKGRGR